MVCALTVSRVMQVIKLASLQGGIISELTAAAQPTAALPSEALQCAGLPHSCSFYVTSCSAPAHSQSHDKSCRNHAFHLPVLDWCKQEEVQSTVILSVKARRARPPVLSWGSWLYFDGLLFVST